MLPSILPLLGQSCQFCMAFNGYVLAVSCKIQDESVSLFSPSQSVNLLQSEPDLTSAASRCCRETRDGDV